MKVSVCIAIKNCSNFIKDSLSSILNQNFKEDWEVILGDDCSNDNTIDIALETLKYIGGKVPVRLYSSDKNVGCGLRRNSLINVSYGDYIALADGDDLYPLDRIREQYSIASSDSGIFAISGSCNIIDEFGNYISSIKKENMTDNEIFHYLSKTYENPICDPCSFFEKNTFIQMGGYSCLDQNKLIPDLDLWMRFFEFSKYGIIKNKTILVFKNTWVDYRKNPNGNTIRFSREMMRAHGLRRKIFNHRLSDEASVECKKDFSTPGRMELIYEQGY
jgi:glycosyltransferase involved in cell wall biosynthesis